MMEKYFEYFYTTTQIWILIVELKIYIIVHVTTNLTQT